MVNQDYGAPDRKAPLPKGGNLMRYDNCEQIDEDLRALYDIYGSGETSEPVEYLAERLAEAIEAEEPV